MRRVLTRVCGLLLAALVVLAALWWLGVVDRGRPDPKDATSPAGGAGIVGVIVEPDDGRQPFLDEIAAARQSIELQIYLISDDEIIAALIAADQRGVRVRVLLEESPFGGPGGQPDIYARLEDAGIETRWAPPPYRFAHIKTFVFDDAAAVIMNQNLTRSAFTRNREFAVITTRPDDVAAADAIFEADWDAADDPGPGSLVASPSNSRRQLLGLIEGATRTLDIYAEFVRDDESVAALIAAEGRGVAVRLLVPEEEEENGRAILFDLIDAGVDVRTPDELYAHAKVIVADETRAFVGSQNFTTTSLDDNRELGIVLDDAAVLARLDQVFERDFASGRPFT